MRIAFTHNLQRIDNEAEAEFDTPGTVAAITAALRRLGHVVEPIDVGIPVGELVAALAAFRPDLVFNTAEGSRGRCREAFYPALFEQLGLPHTGADAFACTVTLDKRLSKALVAPHGVPTPRGALIERADAPLPDLRMPVIVKPNFEGSSKGIGDDAVCEDAADLPGRVAAALAHFPDGVLIEEFIVGRDVVVPFLEGVLPETDGVLPPAEYRIDAAARAAHGPLSRFGIYDFALKHGASEAVEVRVPAELSADTLAALLRHAAVVNKVLGVRDLGRSDFRIDPDGGVWFLEVNALPSLEPGASIYVSAAHAGLGDEEAVLATVVASACRRFGLDPAGAPAEEITRPRRVGFTYNLKRRAPTADGGDDEEAEYDSPRTIDAIVAALESGGHEVVRIEATPQSLSRIGDLSLDAVFNMAEGVRGRGREALVPALLELHGIPYSGSDPATMAIALDKGLAKRVVREAGVATPRFAVVHHVDDAVPDDLGWPRIVKPVAEGSSKGVLKTSVVRDADEQRRAIAQCTGRYGQPALVEAFLPGREFTVGLLGGGDGLGAPEVLPPMEILFGEAAGDHPVYAFEHKLDFTDAVRYRCPAEVAPELGAELARVARAVFTALGCRDVARVDLRLDAAGDVHFIECNPLPGLSPGWSDLCLIAEAAGLGYEALIHRVLAPALSRANPTPLEL